MFSLFFLFDMKVKTSAYKNQVSSDSKLGMAGLM